MYNEKLNEIQICEWITNMIYFDIKIITVQCINFLTHSYIRTHSYFYFLLMVQVMAVKNFKVTFFFFFYEIYGNKTFVGNLSLYLLHVLFSLYIFEWKTLIWRNIEKVHGKTKNLE